jgi:hypothetical protein
VRGKVRRVFWFDSYNEHYARFAGRTEKRVGELEPVPLDPGEEMPFGKHEGKTLIEIAREHPGYAEWGVEELDNRPEVPMGPKRALNLANDDPDEGDQAGFTRRMCRELHLRVGQSARPTEGFGPHQAVQIRPVGWLVNRIRTNRY